MPPTNTPLEIDMESAIRAALSKNDAAQALELANQAITAQPQNDVFYFLAAFAHAALEQIPQALGRQQQAIALSPLNVAYHFNAGVYASMIPGNDATLRSMLHYRNALHIDPNHADSLWNYGEHLRLEGHIERAIACFEKLLAMNKPYDYIYNRLAACYEYLDDTAKTDEIYKVLLKNKNDVIAEWSYATEQLRRENFKNGFEYYNKRFNCSWLNNAYHYPFPQPLLTGKIPAKKTILVHGEQGLGDEMMFASTMNEFLAQAKAVGSQVVIACKAPLARLFHHSFPEAKAVLAHNYDQPADLAGLQIDVQIPMGNLLARFRASHADFEQNQTPYFSVDNERIAYYNQQIEQLGRQALDGRRRFRVGLMWGTVSAETVSRFELSASRRSIALPLFAPLADLIDDVEFISLQNHERGAEAAQMPDLDMVDFSLDQMDFYDTAAIIKNLDLVITVDTSVSHLAGGLGTKTWVPLIHYPDWRHGKSRTTSFWYHNTTYFRQQTKNDWREVIERIRVALAQAAQAG